MISVVLLLALFVHVQNTFAYTCPSTPVTVKNQGQPYAFPAPFTDDHYGANQNCTWNVQVPDGYFITFGYVANTVNDATLWTTQVRGSLRDDTILAGDRFTTVDDIMCDQLVVNLVTNAAVNGYFHFNITWNKTVPPAQPLSVVNDFGLNVFDMSNMDKQNTVTFATSNSAQLFLSLDARFTNDSSQIIVYDGTAVVAGADYKTLEWVEDLVDVSHDGIKSTKSALTIYSPNPQANLYAMYAFVNDLKDVQSYTFYGGMVALPWAINVAEMSAFFGESCAYTITTTEGAPLIVNNIDFQQGDASILAYEGVPSDRSVAPLAKFSKGATFPYKFTVPTVTFVVDSVSSPIEYFIQASSNAVYRGPQRQESAPRKLKPRRVRNSSKNQISSKTFEAGRGGRFAKTVVKN